MENGTKGSQHPKKSFGMSLKKPGELFLKTTTSRDDKKSLSKRVQTLLKNKGGHNKFSLSSWLEC